MVLREKFWIDDKVQGVLIGRVMLYWAVGVIYLGLGIVGFQFYENPNWSILQHLQCLFSQVWPWLPSMVLLVPLIVCDIVRLSNLFAGPIYRLRNHLNQLVDDPECVPLKFRVDDYWQELSVPVNRLQTELLILRKQVNELNAVIAESKEKEIAEEELESTTEADDESTLRDISDVDASDEQNESNSFLETEVQEPVEALPVEAAAEATDEVTDENQSDVEREEQGVDSVVDSDEGPQLDSAPSAEATGNAADDEATEEDELAVQGTTDENGVGDVEEPAGEPTDADAANVATGATSTGVEMVDELVDASGEERDVESHSDLQEAAESVATNEPSSEQAAMEADAVANEATDGTKALEVSEEAGPVDEAVEESNAVDEDVHLVPELSGEETLANAGL